MKICGSLLALLLTLAPAAFADPPSFQETARFLAGLPVAGPLQPLEGNPGWIEHARFFDNAWAKLEHRQLAPIRGWSADCLREAFHSRQPVFYTFSGPDFLYAQTFFPNSETYVLCGTEPIGNLPDVSRIPTESLGPTLRNIGLSLSSVMNYSFFITKDMRMNLQTGPINGTLPILYVFLARLDCQIRSVSFVAKGVKITFSRAGSDAVQTLYYFNTDLSDGGQNGAFFKFCESLGPGVGFTKSASYLMQENNFSRVRNWLLNHCHTIVQDDSGISVQDFDPQKWRFRFFGTYRGPIEIFKKYYQPALAEFYQTSSPPPLTFGIGYRGWNPALSTFMAATRR